MKDKIKGLHISTITLFPHNLTDEHYNINEQDMVDKNDQKSILVICTSRRHRCEITQTVDTK